VKSQNNSPYLNSRKLERSKNNNYFTESKFKSKERKKYKLANFNQEEKKLEIPRQYHTPNLLGNSKYKI